MGQTSFGGVLWPCGGTVLLPPYWPSLTRLSPSRRRRGRSSLGDSWSRRNVIAYCMRGTDTCEALCCLRERLRDIGQPVHIYSFSSRQRRRRRRRRRRDVRWYMHTITKLYTGRLCECYCLSVQSCSSVSVWWFVDAGAMVARCSILCVPTPCWFLRFSSSSSATTHNPTRHRPSPHPAATRTASAASDSGCAEDSCLPAASTCRWRTARRRDQAS